MSAPLPPTAAVALPPAGLGTHLLLDLHGVDAALLDDVDTVADLLAAAATAGGATVVDRCLHRFSPQGVSGVVVLAESHVAIHTWPEHGVAAVDVFTCGEPEIAQAVADQVCAALGPSACRITRVERLPPGPPETEPSRPEPA